MAEVMETQTQTPGSSPITPGPIKGKKNNKKKMVKRLIALGVALALLVGIGVGMWYLVFRDDSEVGIPLTDVAQISSIQSVVQGSGSLRAKESAAITLNQSGTVMEVFVTEGQTVFAGDPLYTIDSQAAEDALTEAQEKVDDLYKDLADLQEDASNLTIRAPFAGKIQEIQDFELDQDVTKGASVATLVNDKQLKLSLYFSYAYENDIRVGQSVDVSVPAVMGSLTGTVEKVNKVSYISPEGAVHFEAVIVFKNPGTLTADMDASAVLTTDSGDEIYPYQNGKTEYYETRNIVAKASGPVTSLGTLMNHANVETGEALLYLGSSTIDSDIRAKQTQIDDALEDLTTAQEGLAKFNAVAPIDGIVLSCALEVGQEVKENDTVITISNTTTMIMDISVDDKNIAFIKAGMQMELTDGGEVFYGTVTSVSMEGELGTGTTSYPVQLTVDNSMGMLYNGSWPQYNLVTSESKDCIVIPNQCVKRLNGTDGEIYTVVFVKAESKPENAVDVDPAMLGETMPTSDEDFWPVPVVTGISDTYSVEIVEGLEEGAEVFTNRETEQSYGW